MPAMVSRDGYRSDPEWAQPDRYEPLRSVRSQGTHRPRGGMRFMTSVVWMICPAIAVLMIPPVILQAPVITDVTNGRDRIY